LSLVSRRLLVPIVIK
jgi:hypothetical protein